MPLTRSSMRSSLVHAVSKKGLALRARHVLRLARIVLAESVLSAIRYGVQASDFREVGVFSLMLVPTTPTCFPQQRRRMPPRPRDGAAPPIPTASVCCRV